MRKRVFNPVAAAFLVLISLSCQNPMNPAAEGEEEAAEKGFFPFPGPLPAKGDLIAGRAFKAGTVTASNDTENIYVKYSLASGWEMTESRLAVAWDLSGIPQTAWHAPIPERFPYKASHAPSVTEYTYTIPLSEAGAAACGCGRLYLAANAIVRRIPGPGRRTFSYSAWASGERGHVFEWWTRTPYLTYDIERIWEGDFTVHTAGDLEGYTRVTGKLSISGVDTDNVDWLACLGAVGGDLEISDNQHLADISGLEGLSSIGGSLLIHSNGPLNSLAGLANLSCLGGDININNTFALKNLNGLEGLTRIKGNVYLGFNDGLVSVSGLENIRMIEGNFTSAYNLNVTGLSGLRGLKALGGTFFIDHTGPVTSLSGLDNLRTVGGDLNISTGDGSHLLSLEGLEGLTCVGGRVLISMNTALEKLDGLDGLRWVRGDFDIELNDHLTDVSALVKLISIGGSFKIRNNIALPDLAGLEGLRAIGGNLDIVYNESLPTALAEEFAYSPALYVAGTITVLGNLP